MSVDSTDVVVSDPHTQVVSPGLQMNAPEREQDWDTGAVKVEYGETEDVVTSQFSFKRLLMFAGPGMLVAIAYIDPGNLESDLHTGTFAGYSLGWLILMATLCGFTVQLVASRLGVVMGKDLAQTIRAVYPAGPRNVLWFMTEVAIIGSDIQEVIGSSIAITLLSDGAIPLWAGVVITGFDTFLLLFLVHLGVRKLESFFAVLVAVMALSFGVMSFKADVPVEDVVLGVVVPELEASQLNMAAGIIGCLVMPHNLFLHSALVQTRKIDVRHSGAKKEAILYNAVESGVAVVVTVWINICVMAIFAKGFFELPEDIKDDVGLSTAGEYLGHRFGKGVKYIWAIGLLAAGQTSTMTGTYTGQFVMTGFLNLKVSRWKRAIVTRGIAIVPALTVAIVYAGSNKMDKLNQLLNVVQAIQLPFALLPAVYIATRADLMGSFVVKSGFRAVVYAMCALLLVVNLSVVVTVIKDNVESGLGPGIPSIVAAVLYISFVIYLVVGPQAVYKALSFVPGRFARRLAAWIGDDGLTVFGEPDTLPSDISCSSSLSTKRSSSGGAVDASEPAVEAVAAK